MTSAPASIGGMIRTLSALNEGAARSFASRAAPFIAISALMGFFTIVLYWGLFFIDPTLVNYAGERLNFSREIYLHFAGPALLFFDAFFLKRYLVISIELQHLPFL